MDTLTHKEEYKGYNIEVSFDPDPIDPRGDDNLGTMICFHSRYNLGDTEAKKYTQSELFINFGSEKEIREIIAEYFKGKSLSDCKYLLSRYDLADIISDNDLLHPKKSYPDSLILMPLYLYDHSGITISTGGFSCPWDSGQVGYIYVTKEKLKSEGLEDRSEKDIREYLKNEVQAYDNYLTGMIYCFSILDANGEVVESSYNYDSEQYAIEEAKSMIDCLAQEDLKNGLQQDFFV